VETVKCINLRFHLYSIKYKDYQKEKEKEKKLISNVVYQKKPKAPLETQKENAKHLGEYKSPLGIYKKSAKRL
jgi:ribosomal protein S4